MVELVLKGFDSYSDEELIRCLRGGNALCEEVLVLRYVPYVRSLARPYFLAGGDFEDLIQEGMIGLINALSGFDPCGEATFKTYATFCIKNRVYSAIRQSLRGKNSPLNNYVSIEDAKKMNSSESVSFEAGAVVDPVKEIIDREEYKELLENVSKLLSKFEAKVLGLYLEGLSYSEISSRLEKSPKAVDNAIQRIRRKFSDVIK